NLRDWPRHAPPSQTQPRDEYHSQQVPKPSRSTQSRPAQRNPGPNDRNGPQGILGDTRTISIGRTTYGKWYGNSRCSKTRPPCRPPKERPKRNWNTSQGSISVASALLASTGT